ncbi:MAG TPA: 3-phosphoshikimate 1-carboxyvinyltransferase [Gaiellaceae bacterium]|jgi:3-phosphoshikimate 1-carboxyvinyltransferase|nr:3-phosphoshikimate 1-carboxyvinyltransferase [Gaiellaceae bacterium]
MRVEPVPALVGHLAVPGDKSISHRAVLVGAIAEGETRILGFGRSADTESTIGAVRALGVEVLEDDVDELRVRGRGLRGLEAPAGAIDCGNAGTLMRILAGVLSGQRGSFELVGDSSLSARPMERVAVPLRRMGAGVRTTDGHAPVVVEGADLHGIDYELPVPSAQVKSAVLLAGLVAEGETTVVERFPTRDHTERLLERAGATIRRRPTSVTVRRADRLVLDVVEIPGDLSSAAPLLVAALTVPGSELTVHGIGLNPRRTGLIDVLERMGARIAVYNRRQVGGEPAGDVEVRASELVGATVAAAEVPALVDELPLLALAACHARGETVVRGAAELRVKESDRLEGVVEELRRIGGHVRATRDGFRVKGVPARLRGGAFDSRGDHRLAMLGAVAGVSSIEGVELEGAEAVEASFPGFFSLLGQLAA